MILAAMLAVAMPAVAQPPQLLDPGVQWAPSALSFHALVQQGFRLVHVDRATESPSGVPLLVFTYYLQRERDLARCREWHVGNPAGTRNGCETLTAPAPRGS